MSSENIDVDWKNAESIFKFTVKNLDGEDVSLEKFRGKVCLIVNVASYCGFARSNYKQLNELYDKFKETGKFAILAFPCNQWLEEPSCETDLKEFVVKKKIEFDFFGKVNVNGKQTIPLYSYLKSKQGGVLGDFIKWNFTKFLCDKNGIPVQRYAPTTTASRIEKDLIPLLGEA